MPSDWEACPLSVVAFQWKLEFLNWEQLGRKLPNMNVFYTAGSFRGPAASKLTSNLMSLFIQDESSSRWYNHPVTIT